MITPDHQELRDERRAIMETEGATEEEIQAVFLRYPSLYGSEI